MRRIARLLFIILACAQCADPVTDIGPTTQPLLDVVSIGCSGTSAARGDSLRLAVENAPNNRTISLGSCEYWVNHLPRGGYNSGILIDSGLTGLTITGAGPGNTVVTFARSVYIGFEIRDSVRNLSISRMSIRGLVSDGTSYSAADDTLPATHGVASFNGAVTHADSITLRELEVYHFAVGISINSAINTGNPNEPETCEPSRFRNVSVISNDVHDLYTDAVTGAVGYGIHNACATNVRIAENVVRRAQRHSIYQARTAPGESNVVIERNLIVDHRHGDLPWDPDFGYGAISVWRSNDVAVVNNVVIAAHAYGIDAGEENQSYDTKGVYIVGNKFFKPTGWLPSGIADIWLRQSEYGNGEIWLWGNAHNESVAPSSATVTTHGSIEGWEPIQPSGWPLTNTIELASDSTTGCGGVPVRVLYVMNAGILYRVIPCYQEQGSDPSNWANAHSTTGWVDLAGMAVMTDGSDAYVYVLSDYKLWRVTPQDTNGAWPAVRDLYTYSAGDPNYAATGNRVFTLRDAASIYKTTPLGSTGYWPYATTSNWAGAYGMRAGIDGS
jgi:hypothetical protein